MGMKKAPIQFSPSLYGSYSRKNNGMTTTYTLEPMSDPSWVLYKKFSEDLIVESARLGRDEAVTLLNRLYEEGFAKHTIDNAPVVKWFNE